MSLQWKAIFFLTQCRKQKYHRKSGGIGVFIEDDMYPHVTVIESDFDYILWFKISKLSLKTDEDFVFRAIYVTPSESRFNTQDELDIFEVEICNTCILYKYVCLLGDFNARTHNKDDFLNENDFFNDHFGFDDTVRNLYNVSPFCQS